jgi:hypothetical protein
MLKTARCSLCTGHGELGIQIWYNTTGIQHTGHGELGIQIWYNTTGIQHTGHGELSYWDQSTGQQQLETCHNVIK